MRVLVTNDDGIRAPGLAVLARAVASLGLDVVVAAPDEDRSGSGAGIGPVHEGTGIRVTPTSLPGLDAVPAFSVDGPPALAVLSARLGAFDAPPDLVVSGVNPGHNTGRSVLHSGTVGAALTAANFGLSGLAVSVGFGDPVHWDTAAAVATAATRWMLDAPHKTVLNVNVPNLPLSQLRGVRWAPLAPFGTVRAALTDVGEGMLQVELRATEDELDPDTDTALVTEGWVTVTALSGPRALPESSLDGAVGAIHASLHG